MLPGRLMVHWWLSSGSNESEIALLGESKQPLVSFYNTNIEIKDVATPGGRDSGLLNCCSHFLSSIQPLPDEQMKNQILKVHTMNETLNTFQNISETNMSLWQSHLFLSSENILQFKYCESSILSGFPGTNLLCRVVADVETAIFYQSRSLLSSPVLV